MLRQPTENGWVLITHQDHARLAGSFAERWGNLQFPRPEPFTSILEAVRRHDDSWVDRDSAPELTPEGLPSAFTKELVGSYDAFEEIDLASYLKVRGRATELVAGDDSYAAILVSMHTVNLLTEQADLSGLSSESLELHRSFVEGQHKRQQALVDYLLQLGAPEGWLHKTTLRRGFEFLQACDSLSLFTCVGYPEPLPLRHRHPNSTGELVEILCRPCGGSTYALAPWPFDAEERLTFTLPARAVSGHRFDSVEAFRSAYAAGEDLTFAIEIIPGT